MIIFIGLSMVHSLMFLWFYFHWKRIPIDDNKIELGSGTFTILIPVRNESENIQNLLHQIDNQDYPKSFYEVVVIDDNSDDSTASIVSSIIDKVSYPLSIQSLNDQSGKKAAISLGITLSKNEYIITVDGDCSVGESWISSYARGYLDKSIMMQTGPVAMTGKSLIASMQTIEFSTLIGAGAAALHSGRPLTCNGANLSYRKSAFLAVEGYEGNDQIPSGDDEFLLHKVHSKFPHGVKFLKNQKAIVTTPAKEHIRDLINQRIRWSSKWKFHKSIFARISTVYLFLDYLVYTIIILMIVSGFHNFKLYLTVISIRILVDFLFIGSVSRFFKTNIIKAYTIGLGLQIIYPAFVTFLGLASIFGRYSWKGRKYK